MTDRPEVSEAAPLDEDAREKEAQAIRGLATAYSRLRQEIGKIIIGQQDVAGMGVGVQEPVQQDLLQVGLGQAGALCDVAHGRGAGLAVQGE